MPDGLTPKEVLNLLVDLDGRWGGIFNKAIDDMHVAIDDIWQTGKTERTAE